MDIKRTLEHLINTPTPTGQEWRLIPFLVKWLETCGFTVQIQEVERNKYLTPEGRYWNIVASRGTSPLTIVVHYDTVPAKEYKATFKDGKVYGRGSVDVKGQLAALLHAIKNTSEPVNVIFVCDEEVGGSGSEQMPIDPEQVYVVLEPTGLQPVITHVGAVEAEVIFHGKGGHGSLNHDNSAFASMMEFLNGLNTMFPEQNGYGLHRTTVYKVFAGSEMLSIPSNIVIGLDIRVFPEETASEIYDILRNRVVEIGGELKLKESADPVSIPRDQRWNWFLENWAGAGLPTNPLLYPSWTDAVNIIERGGWAIVVGAGDLSVAHSDDEHINLDGIFRLQEGLEKLIGSQKELEKVIKYVRQQEYV